MNPKEKVAAYLKLVRTSEETDCDTLSHSLQQMGLQHADAERLIAFVPIAFAQVLLKPRGVRFQDGFLVRDSLGRTVRGKLVGEPFFVEAKRVALQLQRGDDVAIRLLLSVAALSAELSVARDLATAGDFSGIVLTEPVLLRLPLDAAAATRRRWWKF